MGIRFTKENVEKTLLLNEGFKFTVNYTSKNSKVITQYMIKDGHLCYHEKGESKAEGPIDNIGVCDYPRTARLLRAFKERLKLPI